MKSLKSLCLLRIHNLLKKRTWRRCATNPFSYLPSQLVDELMELSIRLSSNGAPKITHLFLLLTSGKLTRLEFRFDIDNNHDLFHKIINVNGCKSVRCLRWHSRQCYSIALASAFIGACPKLEEFHSNALPDFEVFKNCKELKILRFAVSQRNFEINPVDYSLLASLENLKVFHFKDMDVDMMVKALENCPQLFSLGPVDSLNAFERINTNNMRKCSSSCHDNSRHFQLRGCIWGEDVSSRMYLGRRCISSSQLSLLKSKFPDKLSIAVSLCPFVEELKIFVPHAYAIKELKNLKNLSVLTISLSNPHDDGFLSNFYEVLLVIGPQLKFLSVTSARPVAVDVICNHCSHLQSLEILGSATANCSIKCNVLLKKLRISKADEKCLLFILPNCNMLEELDISDALALDNILLNKIMKLNPLANLKLLKIKKCNLSKNEWGIFLEKAVSLERVNFSSFGEDIKTLIDELKLTNVNYVRFLEIDNEEYFLHLTRTPNLY